MPLYILLKILYLCCMSNLYKTIALFFAATLLFLSTNTQNCDLLLTSPLPNTQNDNSYSYFSTEKPEFLLLYRNDERSLNSIRNLPLPSIKNSSQDFHYKSPSPEIRIFSLNSGYLSYSVTVDRSLDNIDIVFPFHYFW
jgi:hypothetical protein